MLRVGFKGSQSFRLQEELKTLRSRRSRTAGSRSGEKKKSLIFLLVGFLCFASAFSLKAFHEWQENLLSFSSPPQEVFPAEEDDLPARILITKVRIDLPVSEAKVVDDQWEIFPDQASYLLGSGLPGKKGNTVIYAHNKNYLFGPIRWLERDNEIKVINKKGEEFIYQVVETKTVSPQEVEVLSPTKEAILTLYTCAGFLDRERFVVVAGL